MAKLLEERARELNWQAAAKQVDWMQVLLNLMNGQETGRDGQPCFFIGGGHFCGRAKFWAGHDEQHKFVSLLDLLTQVQAEARLAALEEAAQVIDQCNREGPYNAIQGASRIREIIELEKPRKWIQSDAQAAAPAKET